jgi:bacterioferritin
VSSRGAKCAAPAGTQTANHEIISRAAALILKRHALSLSAGSNSLEGDPTMAKEDPFVTDVKSIRARARKHIEQGAITDSYAADRAIVVKLLNEALATELVCILRYRRHHFMAAGINANAVAAEFLTHANEEQQHADQIAARIVQLNGEPDFNPSSLLARSHAEYVEGKGLIDMIKEDLVAERIAIDSYREMIAYIGKKDTTTERMLEGILAVEEEHAVDLVGMLEDLRP